MKNLTSLPFKYDDDTNKKKLKEIWGGSLEKLTPKQRQLLVEILGDLNVPSAATSHLDSEMVALVQRVRFYGHASIQQRCGMVRVLNMSHPLKLNDIYTNVNVLEKISRHRRLEVADLLEVSVSDFERPQLGRIATSGMNGLEAVKKYSKLIVLGRPGSGKTTLLQHVALQCSSGELQANRVPIFITLKDFAETQQQPSLLEYITEQLSLEAGADTVVAEQLLTQGQMLLLLDGLDEVRETDSDRVLHSLRNFALQFHKNHFVIAGRIAAQEYAFEQFTQVEVADFDLKQIATLATKWFQIKEPVLAKKFMQKLQEDSAIQELATCPLLLQMLCLVFEESGSFPSNRSELYKEGLDILLRKWDALRNIERAPAYKKLSFQQKEDILSQIARITFERGDYFFKQQEIEQYIADYICNLPGASLDLQVLQLESSAVLKLIAAQHGLLVERAQGIYSFSHLTFHEYFTAREIVASSAPQVLETALKRLAGWSTDKRWREVFLLTCGMLRSADYLLQLMKHHIDELVAGDEQLQAFLCSISQKARNVFAPYKPVTVRAFYLDLELARTLDLVGGTLAYDLDHALISGTLTNDLALALALVHDCSLTLTLAHVLAHDRVLTLTFDRDLDRTLALALALVHNHAITLDRAITLEFTLELALTLDRALAHHRVLAPDLERELKQLKAQLPDLNKDTEKIQVWWKAFGGAWTEELRAVIIKYRHIGHDWRFSKKQQDKLRQYYDANKLLVECLNSNCYLSQAVRDEISETLLLPLKPVCKPINQYLELAVNI